MCFGVFFYQFCLKKYFFYMEIIIIVVHVFNILYPITFAILSDWEDNFQIERQSFYTKVMI